MSTAFTHVSAQFRRTILTKIHDKPAYDGLNHICNQIEANLSNVQSDLDMSNNCQLGHGETDVQYATISDTPYVKPSHIGSVAQNGHSM